MKEKIDKYDIIKHKLKILQENEDEEEHDDKANVYIEEEQDKVENIEIRMYS